MAENAATPNLRKTLLIVFVLSSCTLMFELIISRMSVFYLNYANSFIAIPLTLFGLAVGSLRVHLGKRKIEDYSISRNLVFLTIFSFIAFAVVFLIFSQLFHITHRSRPSSTEMILKTLAFVVAFLPPFYFVGKILTALYALNRKIIGKIYSLDLFGAALACFVTPLLFHFIDLPYLIFICLLAIITVTTLSFGKPNWKVVAAFVVVNLLVLPTLIFLEGRYDLRKTVSHNKSWKVEEIAHKWNEFSRVSLLRVKQPNGNIWYKIIHDNAESNVAVIPYRPGEEPKVPLAKDVRIPFLLERNTDDILVMFAGSGRDMIELESLGGGKRILTGVELNPLCIDFAVDTPEIADMRIKEFYDLPNVNMVVMEGRRFLDSDRSLYDLVYIGSAAATSQYKSGHSRKYLDTKEAMAAYYDHLRDDGMMLFHCQPAVHFVESLKALHAERGLPGFDQRIMLMTEKNKRLDRCDTTVYSKKPFTPAEVTAVTQRYGNRVHYAPGYKRNRKFAAQMVTGKPLDELALVTDNRPFVRMLDFENFRLFPSKKWIKSISYYRSWIKIATLLFIGAVLVVILAFLYVKRAKMPPANMMLYLLITGFAYMLVEITYIAKLELFLENPLYSMALLLSIFLTTNAVGSALYNRYHAKMPMTVMPLLVGALVLVTLWAMDFVIAHRLGMGLWLKVPLTVLLTAPVGVCLGLFYPYVVTWLTEHDRADAVPITYGISTLSSVAGATYAMTMIINLGFTNIIHQAAVGYAALTLLLGAMRLVRR
ncbi:MAG TPA: hypothetical protein PKW95_21430 [bacterium]|nr:hypothetical protein [bacterium]